MLLGQRWIKPRETGLETPIPSLIEGRAQKLKLNPNSRPGFYLCFQVTNLLVTLAFTTIHCSVMKTLNFTSRPSIVPLATSTASSTLLFFFSTALLFLQPRFYLPCNPALEQRNKNFSKILLQAREIKTFEPERFVFNEKSFLSEFRRR